MNVARYHRVSTEHQSLDRQLSATADHAADQWGDTGQIYNDADTGTDTDRSGYQRLMENVESGEIDVVVVKDMSRIARSVRDLTRTIDKLRENGTALDFIDDPITVDPDLDDPTQDLMIQILGAIAEFEAKITQQRVREGIAMRMEEEDYHHGPPPVGFRKEDGMLIETEEYDRVCALFQMVEAGDISKGEASRRIGCARSTVSRAMGDRGELYGLR